MNLEQINDLHERAMSLAEAAIVLARKATRRPRASDFRKRWNWPGKRLPGLLPMLARSRCGRFCIAAQPRWP